MDSLSREATILIVCVRFWKEVYLKNNTKQKKNKKKTKKKQTNKQKKKKKMKEAPSLSEQYFAF